MAADFLPGDANGITRAYFDSILIEMRQLDCAVPDLTYSLFGHRFSSPVMMAALSHLTGKNGNGMVEMAQAAAKLNTVMWAGMGDTRELEDILATGAKTVKIIKPYADEEAVLSRIDHAVQHGVLAVGMDIDHSFAKNGRFDVVRGLAMNAKSLDDLKYYVKRAGNTPFVVKGVLSVADAVKCLEAGVRGIVVSHHHGIMKYAVPPLMALPQIVQAVGGKMEIFVDCGVNSGFDAFKALALGAGAVSIGRLIMPALQQDGPDGAVAVINGITDELRGAMARTGCKTLQDPCPAMLWHDGRPMA